MKSSDDDYIAFWDYVKDHGWQAWEEYLEGSEQMFGMLTAQLTIRTPSGARFGDSVRFGMGDHHYGELLEAMRAWDALTPEEQAAKIAKAEAREAAERATLEGEA